MPFYKDADLFLYPLRWQEPFGLVLAECAIHGVPVVTFELGGVTESVLDDENGFLVTPGDLREMTRKVELLLNNATLRERMGQVGHSLVAPHFSEAHFLKGVRRLMESNL